MSSKSCASWSNISRTNARYDMNSFPPEREHALTLETYTYLYLLRVQDIHVDASVEALQLVLLVVRFHEGVVEIEDDCYLI